MRRIVVAIVVALLAFTVIGCGTAEDTAAEDAPVTEEPEAAPAPAEPEGPEYLTDRSANDDDIAPAPFPSFTTTLTPYAFQAKLDAGRPMVIHFYDSEQLVTDDVREEIDAVVDDYRGLIDMVTFDVSGNGDATAAEAATMYANELGVTSTPYTLIVDRDSFITWRWKGYAESGVIKREVERATR
jgi:hypothetical protein